MNTKLLMCLLVAAAVLLANAPVANAGYYGDYTNYGGLGNYGGWNGWNGLNGWNGWNGYDDDYYGGWNGLGWGGKNKKYGWGK
ncbi:hypothetical protein DPMN_055609 [Dreissena polymorpha]|uniref:Uncharacterized protein n=1 Tax=Dreissena polymorpha TaxID=45954 RepID=A0A9D4CQ98_DREPO|nr:hypothetical protein DPMN_055609 [Dreissena polymorpha]